MSRATLAKSLPPLSVAFVSPGWPLDRFPNGVVPYISTTASELRGSGHHVSIIAHNVAEGDCGDVYDLSRFDASRRLPRRVIDGLRRRLAPANPDRGPVCRSLVRVVLRAVAERGVQILEMEEAFGFSRCVQRSNSLPVVVRLHGPWFVHRDFHPGTDYTPFGNRLAAEGEGIRAADGVTAPSLEVLEQTRAHYGIPLEDADVIPNPVPIPAPSRRWTLEGCDRDLVLFVGRFDRHKGGDVMIDAFARLIEVVPRARLCFVGPDRGFVDHDGRNWTIMDFLRERVPDALSTGRVEWLGQRPHSELAELRRKAFVTVVPSRYETFGLTVTEGMALGCPVVASRVGGISEIVEDGVDGLLCNPGDPDDLAEKLAMTFADPERAVERGRLAAEKCQRLYRPEVVAAQTAAYYRSVLARHQSSSRTGKT